jgi:hypothetical protein
VLGKVSKILKIDAELPEIAAASIISIIIFLLSISFIDTFIDVYLTGGEMCGTSLWAWVSSILIGSLTTKFILKTILIKAICFFIMNLIRAS